MPTPNISAIPENLKYVDRSQNKAYLNLLFGDLPTPFQGHICFRGIGEKGTPQEGVFRENGFFIPGVDHDKLFTAIDRYAQYQVAAFIVPAVLKCESGRAEDVGIFTVLLTDLDTGDTDQKLQFLTKHLGVPSMVICSGGKTDLGTDKYHVYYKLSQPSSDISRIVRLRDSIARKVGGDVQFGLGVASNPYGRSHQPIRIAGTCHGKNGVYRMVTIQSIDHFRKYDLDAISGAIESMPVSPWG